MCELPSCHGLALGASETAPKTKGSHILVLKPLTEWIPKKTWFVGTSCSCDLFGLLLLPSQKEARVGGHVRPHSSVESSAPSLGILTAVVGSAERSAKLLKEGMIHKFWTPRASSIVTESLQNEPKRPVVLQILLDSRYPVLAGSSCCLHASSLTDWKRRYAFFNTEVADISFFTQAVE